MKTWMKSLLAGVALAVGALSPAWAAGKTVIIGINSLTAIYWPTYVARAKGFFREATVRPHATTAQRPTRRAAASLNHTAEVA